MGMIKGAKVLETMFKRNRFYVKLELEGGRIKTMPRANYVWLKSNPAFAENPRGYVIHHLDHDETNDDPSNLALMQKHCHTAHHWKHNKLKKPKPVKLVAGYRFNGEMDCYSPEGDVLLRYREDRKVYQLDFKENVGGKIQRIRISMFKGVKLDSQDKAERARKEILGGRNGHHLDT